MEHRILVIDDDEPIHYIVKNLLGQVYELEHARNAQEAIDILSRKTISLILSDIHMPGLSGLELLQSLRADKEKKDIPVLVMTNLPTVEKERKALDLGASDFLKKNLFNDDKDQVLERIEMKLVTNVVVDELSHSLEESKNKLVMSLMDSALLGLFDETVDVLCAELLALLDASLLGVWVIRGEMTALINLKGDKVPKMASIASIVNEPAFAHLKETRVPYLNNHIYGDSPAFFKEYSTSKNIPAEVAIPLYSVTESGLIHNSLSVPEDAKLFGVMIIKRDSLFSMTEFELISKLVTQAGTILWRLFKTNQ